MNGCSTFLFLPAPSPPQPALPPGPLGLPWEGPRCIRHPSLSALREKPRATGHPLHTPLTAAEPRLWTERTSRHHRRLRRLHGTSSSH